MVGELTDGNGKPNAWCHEEVEAFPHLTVKYEIQIVKKVHLVYFMVTNVWL